MTDTKTRILDTALNLFNRAGERNVTTNHIAEGLGKDIESAVQRAAEAALTQVVGSFIDSDKLIEKRKQIKDGIKTQTKTITSKLSEYSQGIIQRLEILEIVKKNSLVRVTAKVTVRIEGCEPLSSTSIPEGTVRL